MKNHLFVPNIVSWASTPSLIKTIRQLFVFLKNPRQSKAPTVPGQQKLQVLLQLILTEVFVKALVIGAVAYLYYLFGISTQQVNLSSTTGNKSLYLVLLLVVVYGPLRDELIFRLPLVYSRRSMLIALAAFLAGYAPLVMQEANLGLLHYGAAALALACFAAALLLSPGLHACIRQPWKTDYASLFYIITLVFALQYLVNYPYINLPVFMLPVLVLLQWIEGLFLGYTRLHLGFKWSTAQHIFQKALLLITFLSFYSNT